MTPREQWAAAMIRAAEKPIPRYGSEEWLALPDGDRRRTAAVVIAAESWSRECDELEVRLLQEVLAGTRVHKELDDADFIARRDAHRDSWTGRGFKPDPRDVEDITREWEQWAAGEAS